MDITLKTTIIGGMEPFDIRRCPVWAIPQLALFKRRCTNENINIEFYELKHGNGIGRVLVLVEGSGIFHFAITKWDMNSQEKPTLYPMIPIVEPTQELKAGDYVRSKNNDLAGVIREIGPCDWPGCDKTSLTLDPPGQDPNDIAATQFYYHADSFEVVSPE